MIGDQVTAYDPSTGTSSTQTVQHVWVNHDHDLLDVTLHEDGHATQASSTDKTQRVATKAHGSQAPPSDETIHTTEQHPWLTTDRGWVKAGDLRVGEHVVELGGRTATITALAVHPGAATYYNLTVSQLHTYAVGASRAVVHNTDLCDTLPTRPGGTGPTSGFLDLGDGKPIALNSALRSGMETVDALPEDTPALGSRWHMWNRNHVEAKAAAIMRAQGIDDATLHINNIPCSDGVYNCTNLLPHMLPEGATLNIHVQGTPEGSFMSFTGLPDASWDTWWSANKPPTFRGP